MTLEEWLQIRPTQTPMHRLPMTENDQHRATWQAATQAEREQCVPWIEDLTACIAVMDEKGRTGPAGEDHTTMLWTKDWAWMRQALLEVLEDMREHE